MCEFKKEQWLEKWIDEYGEITSYSFMVYGPISVRDNAIINFGVTDSLIQNGLSDIRYYNIIEDVEMSELLGLHRGWSIQWVFAGKVDYKIVPKIIKEGLQHLKLKYEYIGKIGADY